MTLPRSEHPTAGWASCQQTLRLVARGRITTWPRRPLIVGIVNINDDSFSNDGSLDIETAFTTARRMIEAGADVIDVGGESARPNRPPISIEEEIRRVRPFLGRFEEICVGLRPRDAHQIYPPLLSINTWRPEVARALLAHGGHILNDMGALPDDANARACAETGAALLIMHSVGEPKVDHRHVRYSDVLKTVTDFFQAKIDLAQNTGVPHDSIILDPGMDFAKPCEDNLALIRNLRRLWHFERPLLLPVSRKRTISETLGGRAPAERDAGTVGLVVSCALRGANLLRVHNVDMTYASLKVLEATFMGGR